MSRILAHEPATEESVASALNYTYVPEVIIGDFVDGCAILREMQEKIKQMHSLEPGQYRDCGCQLQGGRCCFSEDICKNRREGIACAEHEGCFNSPWSLSKFAIQLDMLYMENGNLFARIDIPKGQYLGEFIGTILPKNYMLPENLDTQIQNSAHAVIPETSHLIVADKFRSAMSLVRTSTNSNCDQRSIIHQGIIKTVFVASMPIKAGDKILRSISTSGATKNRETCLCKAGSHCPYFDSERETIVRQERLERLRAGGDRQQVVLHTVHKVTLWRFFQSSCSVMGHCLRHLLFYDDTADNLRKANRFVFYDLHAWYYAPIRSERRYYDLKHYDLALKLEDGGIGLNSRRCSLCDTNNVFEADEEMIIHFKKHHKLPPEIHECYFCRQPSQDPNQVHRCCPDGRLDRVCNGIKKLHDVSNRAPNATRLLQ